MADHETLSSEISSILGIDEVRARRIVDAFDRFVAVPLTVQLNALEPRQIAARNPFVYAALGAASVAEWVERVTADKLTSAAEGLVGNFLEEVARILSGGTKPGSGVDLQRDLNDTDSELYAIQSTVNTKNAGGRRSDLQGLEKAAGALRAQRRHVHKFVAYLFGRSKTTTIGDVTHLSSEEFWLRVSGQAAFLPKLLQSCVALSALYREKATTGGARLAEATATEFGDDTGQVLYAALFEHRGRAPSRKLSPPSQ